ncbi:beta-L-arabinofuranosidase domain-containing protein [Bowmanella dokdonensis]|uniref:Glycoside hydrolase family 127 protein n=2 Tax=Bowmanella dokdonensis TaxID=751969 RepID=A0A939IT40_9ALTE|nr:glycoside hydrolase family 127 protein [Bowmanella dokdonensis]
MAAMALYLAAGPVSAVELFDLHQVSLTESPFAHAQKVNVQYLLTMEPDRLLAPYLREAGMQAKAEPYGNWESTGLDGHIGGHYLSALSLAYAATGDARLKLRLDYMIDELQKAQQTNGNGYLGGIPDGNEAWQQIQKGQIKADLFSLNDRWVPWYNLHKIFAGLVDAHRLGHSVKARQMLLALGNWLKTLTTKLSDTQLQTMLIAEHGGMNETLVDLYEISGDEAYLILAERFSHRLVLDPLLEKLDKLNGLHANTQIPKVIGYQRVARASGKEDWQQAAAFFWQTVTQKRSVSIGGNSVREHFHDEADFTPMVEDVEGPETCNTYNMLKLSKLLFAESEDPRYLDYYERATYNHILSSQHPVHGGLVYFTPMRPGHYRMYSNVHDSMWCCVGSGIENHSKYAELIYAHDDAELLVNLFIPSRLSWQDKQLSLSLSTGFPDSEAVQLLVLEAGDQSLSLSIRKPGWLDGRPMRVKVNGKQVEAEAGRAGYLTLTRVWQQGDEISLSLDAEPYLEQLPDGSDYYSVLYGPVVLASKVQPFANEKLDFVADDSRMGHIAAGPMCPPEALPMMVGEPSAFLAGLKRMEDEPLAFAATQGIGRPGQQSDLVRLIPFFRLHDSRYQLYWPQMSPDLYPDFLSQAKQRARAHSELVAKTLDQINPGEQQPEAEHDFKGEGSRAGVNKGVHWRDASDWFSYRLSDEKREAKLLRLMYFGGDANRRFEIWLNGHKLADVTLKDKGDRFYEVDYPLPETLVSQGQGGHSLKFIAKPGSIAGGIYGVRLLKAQ